MRVMSSTGTSTPSARDFAALRRRRSPGSRTAGSSVIAAMLEDPEVRLPGERRRRNAERLRREGIDVPAELMARIRALAG